LGESTVLPSTDSQCRQRSHFDINAFGYFVDVTSSSEVSRNIVITRLVRNNAELLTAVSLFSFLIKNLTVVIVILPSIAAKLLFPKIVTHPEIQLSLTWQSL
jgi:hypothetical protein